MRLRTMVMVAAMVLAALWVTADTAMAAAGSRVRPHRPMLWTLAAVADIVVVMILIGRRVDVRLVLVLGALPMFAMTGDLVGMLVKFAGEMANAGTVVPICSALGFAYVLRLTGCDQHLVELLLRPLRRARPLLIPGGIAAGYLVNTAIVSQTGTAAVIGPILVPLLRAGGISPVTAGALLLLGSSMGGELFNPGAVEMRKLAELTALSGTAAVGRVTRFNFVACGTALLVFWVLAARRERGARPATEEPGRTPGPESAIPAGEFRVNLVKAMVPLLPLALLFAASAVPQRLLPAAFAGPVRILTAMLIGIAAAGLTAPRLAGKLSTAFFEGAGYAYTHVISLIVTATVFAEGIRGSGLIEELTTSLLRWPAIAQVVALVMPWALAAVSGTGIAPAVTVMEFMVPEASAMGLDPVRLGALIAMGAHFGRTMSLVAAVVMMCAALSQTTPTELVKRVTTPLLAGGTVLLLATIFRLI